MATSNGELLIVYNIVRNGSLWSNVVFEKEIIETSELDFEHRKAHNFVWQGCFFLSFSQLRRPIGLKFSQACFVFIWWDTPSEKSGRWQLPIVSSTLRKRWLSVKLFLATFRIYRSNLKPIKYIGKKLVMTSNDKN